MLDLLFVEDDAALRDVLRMHLEAEGWTLRLAEDGDAALAACAERLPGLVVLDVMLPKRSGLEVCAALRALYHPSPGVLMLTARDTELDVILGFEVGADDYVIKPCRPRELVARVRALARRLGGAPARASGAPPRPAQSDAIDRGPLRIDLAARRVTVGAQPLRLTPTELELLAFLARAPDRVFSRAQLLEEVFDSTNEGYARNVDCHVTRLRRKLEAAGLDPAPIRTVHGAGYCFDPAR
ncbi:MAG TPA: response regulator transcription factor [Polyangia bacterium]|nr:response regulator transcription factor [Polyangia bacterium]